MINYAVLLFAIAALGGVFLAAHVMRDKFAPWAASLVHAGFGALGLFLLIAVFVREGASQVLFVGFLILLVAALGGFFLASFHLGNRLPPKAVVVIHAGAAVAGFLTILSQVV
ncbi:hypothetical protein ROS1_60530 [Roseibium sp. ROS1]|jgi:hypothetical protein